MSRLSQARHLARTVDVQVWAGILIAHDPLTTLRKLSKLTGCSCQGFYHVSFEQA